VDGIDTDGEKDEVNDENEAERYNEPHEQCRALVDPTQALPVGWGPRINTTSPVGNCSLVEFNIMLTWVREVESD